MRNFKRALVFIKYWCIGMAYSMIVMELFKYADVEISIILILLGAIPICINIINELAKYDKR